jgi:hypothetical protein
MEPSWHGFGAGTGPTQARNRARHCDAYLVLRYSEGVTMRVPLYAPRVNKSLSPATLQQANRRPQGRRASEAYRRGGHGIPLPRLELLYRCHAPELLAASTLPGVVPRRTFPLFRQDAHDLRVNLVTGCNHVFAHRFFERQSSACRRAAMSSKLKRGNPECQPQAFCMGRQRQRRPGEGHPRTYSD